MSQGTGIRSLGQGWEMTKGSSLLPFGCIQKSLVRIGQIAQPRKVQLIVVSHNGF